MDKKQILFCLGVALLLSWPPAAAKVYHWVDHNGISHFSDTPPPGMAPEETIPEEGARTGDKDKPPALRINFELSGVVQDQAGHPLQEVDLTIIEHHFHPPGHYEFKEVRWKKRVNGTFRISCQDCPIHKLYFRKSGYFSKEVQLRFSKEEEARAVDAYSRQLMAGQLPTRAGPQTIVRKNMVVVLEPEGDAVRLVRIHQQLAVSPRGDVMALTDMARRLRGMGNHEFARILADMPAPEIRLFAAPGAFAAARHALANGTYGKGSIGVYLDFSKANGGIAGVQPVGTNPSKNLRAMQKPPRTGYRDRLELLPNVNGRQTYFYFKMGRFYGKGMAAPPFLEENFGGQTCLMSHVQLYLNPEGTPNLRGK